MANEFYTGSGIQAFREACIQSPVCAILVFYPLIPFALVGALAVYHYYLAATDETTNEKIKNTFIRDVNPHNRGCCTNCFYFWYGPRYQP